MLKKVEIEVKSEKEALDKAVELLNVNKEFIQLNLSSEKKGFLGIGASQVYEATINQSLVLLGKKFIEEICSNLGIETKMEFRTADEGRQIIYNLETKDNSFLIGKRGMGLDALQNLLKVFLSQFTQEKLIINLDIGGYHQKRIKMLEITATKTAKEVIHTQKEVYLTNLNSFERRVIHTKLSEWRDVETVSEGEGENRKLVIKPKDK